MSTNRDNFQWRPNDNSVKTQLRYDLEVNHWLRAIKSHEISKGGNTSFGETIGLIMLAISLILNIILFFLICISDLIVWFVDRFVKREDDDVEDKPKKTMTDKEANKMIERHFGKIE